MAMTPRNLIRSSLRAINALGVDGTLSSDQHNDALELLNLMLDSWSIEELLPFDYVEHNVALTANKTNYTIGESANAADRDGICVSQPVGSATNLTINGVGSGSVTVSEGVATMDVPRHVILYSNGANTAVYMTVTGTNTHGDSVSEIIYMGASTVTTYGRKAFKTVTQVASSAATSGNAEVGADDIINTRRPIMIVSAFVRNASFDDYPCYPATRERYNTWTDKDATTTVATEITSLYYDRTYPTGEIFLYKIPSASGMTLYFDMWQPFKTITSATIDTDINLPQAYMLPMRWNLAAELAPEYGKDAELNKTVIQRAMETKEAVKMVNTRLPKPTMLTTPVSTVMGQPGINKS